jgi:hypothetical protein
MDSSSLIPILHLAVIQCHAALIVSGGKGGVIYTLRAGCHFNLAPTAPLPAPLVLELQPIHLWGQAMPRSGFWGISPRFMIQISFMARRAKLTPHEEFYAAIGRFVVQWTGMEFALDLLLLNTRPTQRPAENIRLPHQLDSKIKSIRAQMQYIDDPYRETIEQLLSEISRYASTRHDLMHGAIIDPVINESGITATLYRLLQPARQPRRRPVKATATQITGISEHIRALGDRLL